MEQFLRKRTIVQILRGFQKKLTDFNEFFTQFWNIFQICDFRYGPKIDRKIIILTHSENLKSAKIYLLPCFCHNGFKVLLKSVDFFWNHKMFTILEYKAKTAHTTMSIRFKIHPKMPWFCNLLTLWYALFLPCTP